MRLIVLLGVIGLIVCLAIMVGFAFFFLAKVETKAKPVKPPPWLENPGMPFIIFLEEDEE